MEKKLDAITNSFKNNIFYKYITLKLKKSQKKSMHYRSDNFHDSFIVKGLWSTIACQAER